MVTRKLKLGSKHSARVQYIQEVFNAKTLSRRGVDPVELAKT